ncbi:hypothetical protein [Nonomuraea sediminis]|uniref:hypothetical protein n=1 Tax=Nonomuraea sediminis TaxID=2835864 RepID=UPI001BDBBCD5|nr:hypothetical protein [Nonomuraea sediminis]
MNPRETYIAEATVAAIDFTGRMLGAIEDGNWSYAKDKLSQLYRALDQLDTQLARTSPAAAGTPVAEHIRRESRHYPIGKALYGTPPAAASPLAQAEEAKRRRDLMGELHALTAGYGELTEAPWYPARAGDIVHVQYEALGGETYVVEDSAEEGGLVLRPLHHSAGMAAPGCFAPGMVDDPLMEAWMEAGPHALTLVRDGKVVHGGGAG